MTWPRRRRAQPNQDTDPLLTRPRVAELIDRDPARVTRYYQAGQLPPADEILEGDIPAWRRSTIRSWWLHRGGRFPTVTERYHQQWTDTGIEPKLLEERVLETFPGKRSVLVHIRVYQAMDGGGPVILLGWPKQQSRRDTSEKTLDQIRKVLVEDVEVAQPIWLTVAAETPYRHYFGLRDSIPARVEVRDIKNWPASITPDDVARLIGKSFDVYPEPLYTVENIRARQDSGDQDTPTSTVVIEDAAGLAIKVRQLRSVIQHLERGDTRDLHRDAEVLDFAAGILVDDLSSALTNVDFTVRLNARAADQPLHETGPFYLAVAAQPRTLTPNERALVARYELKEPLVTSKIEAPLGSSRLYETTLRTDAGQKLKALRDMLSEPDLSETSPLRVALTEAERLLTNAVHDSDPEAAKYDRQPIAYTWAADTTEMARYLNQLTHINNIGELPRGLRRRAQSLLDDEYSADWHTTTLLYDEEAELLALVGSDPSYLDRDAAKQLVHLELMSEHHTTMGGRRIPPAAKEALITAYMDDTKQVHLEWPQAKPSDPFALLEGAHLVAPAASPDVERPVFIQRPDGTLTPLSLNGHTHFHGFVWGVSGTDSISTAVHALLTDDSDTRDWRKYPNEADDPNTRTYEWLRRYLLKSHADILDVPCAPILARYQTLRELQSRQA